MTRAAIMFALTAGISSISGLSSAEAAAPQRPSAYQPCSAADRVCGYREYEWRAQQREYARRMQELDQQRRLEWRGQE
ncbi:MAG TPA: hypothetical protein VJ770_00400 [Stellaceae bacterium]|nr:hypothetical protein [Stellaceae bacterium]